MQFRNKKNGSLYELYCIAIDCTNARNGTSMIVYRLHGVFSDQVWVRDTEEFYEKFEAVE